MAGFKWRHFCGEVILWAVRWYCRYGVSYRDLEEMLDEGVSRSTTRPCMAGSSIQDGGRAHPLKTRMVGWYDPTQLIQTAGQVIVSTLLARHVDDRRIQGLVPANERFTHKKLDAGFLRVYAFPKPVSKGNPQMAVFGYARVSREDQELALQVDALTAAGVEPGRLVKEKLSGVAERPAFNRLLLKLGAGDSLIVWKVDRLGRNAVDVQQTVRDLDQRGIRLIITTLGLDTRTPAGRLIFGIMSQLAEFEREQLIERTKAGLEAARRRGKRLGRPRALTTVQARQAARMVREGKSYGEIADMMNVARSTVFKTVRVVGAREA